MMNADVKSIKLKKSALEFCLLENVLRIPCEPKSRQREE